jgi:hypothetical protein
MQALCNIKFPILQMHYDSSDTSLLYVLPVYEGDGEL